MDRILLKSKIHRASVTDANLNYSGSLSIDENLPEAADILFYEKVDVLNINAVKLHFMEALHASVRQEIC